MVIGFGMLLTSSIMALRLVPRAWYGVLVYGLGAIIVCQAIAWLTRERWAGRLLVDLNQPRKKLSYLYPLFLTLYLLFVCFNPVGARSTLSSLALIAYLENIWLTRGWLEIREQGIISSGKLFRWGSIESYEWTSEVVGWGKPSPVVLKVHLGRLLTFVLVDVRTLGKALPPARIPIPPGQREAVDAVLSRYLSDWPGAASGGIQD